MKTRDGVVQLCALWIAGCTGQGEPLLASSARAAESVVFASDLWPGEGIPVIEMRRPALPVYSEPDPTSSVVDTLRGRVGQRVAFDSTRYQTMESGAIRTHSARELTGRGLGHVQHPTLDRSYTPMQAEISVPLAAWSTGQVLLHR